MSDVRALLERGVGDAAPPPDGFERMLRRRDRKRRTQRIAAGAVGFAVFVAAIWIVTGGVGFDRSQTPAVTGPTIAPDPARIGFIGLPPEGATPSAPERGELVLSFFGGTSSGPRTRLFVYADGRIIWQQEASRPFGASEHSTGWLEQRLTSAGVEHIVSEALATGLFDDGDLELQVAERVPCFNLIEVRRGERLVRITYGAIPTAIGCEGPLRPRATAEQTRLLMRLDGRLGDPGAWMPQSAWAVPTIRPYVPSRFRICYGGFPGHLDADPILALLPTQAAELLREHTTTSVRRDVFEGNRHVIYRADVYCSDLTTDEARTFVGALDASGLERTGPYSMMNPRLELNFLVPGSDNVLNVSFDPYLPHGAAAPIGG